MYVNICISNKMNVLVLFIAFLKLSECATKQDTEKDTFFTIANAKQLKLKQFWLDDAKNTLLNKLTLDENKNKAKNVIFFIGDGMSLSTITASRIYDGQLRGIVGERNQLSFEKFPHVALSKTYCANKQVADSACTATAYLSGIKANYLTIGVTANVTLNDCGAASEPKNQLRSIAGWALDAGKAAGVVTTTRVTHASPAGVYASTANRDFESDSNINTILGSKSVGYCQDIARQLVEGEVGKNLKVILGGGAVKFLPNDTKDDRGNYGERLDGKNLIDEWAKSKNGTTKFVSNKMDLLNVNVDHTDYLLGLFSSGHMQYHMDADQNQPTLAEMTEAAIKMLEKSDDGFFLFVEGGRIDHAHHETRAKKALHETVQLSQAVERARLLTSSQDTLIVVTADHGHTMTINGYPEIDNSITGLGTDLSDIDGMPYATLSYANGPAFSNFYKATKNNQVRRVDLRKIFENADNDLQYPVGVPNNDETHGGDDVVIYANGPWAHLFSGVMEQSAIPTVMGFASCIGSGLHSCNWRS